MTGRLFLGWTPKGAVVYTSRQSRTLVRPALRGVGFLGREVRMNRLFLAAVAGAALLVTPAAQAQVPAAPPPPVPVQAPTGGFHTHDGFYLHLEGGFGSLGTKASQAGTSMELSGGAGEFAVGVGYAVTPNLILGGQFWGMNASSPTVKLNGSDLGSASGSIGLSAFGFEATYYFTDLGLYLSAVPSFGTLSASGSGSSGSTKSGFAIKLAVGKEWWVSDNWGIGLNAQYAHSSNEDSGTNPPTWATNYFGVAFSATYN
jgi:hypothetical protein